jgi:hypothetical protein
MAGSAERGLDLAAQSLGLIRIEAEFLHQRWPLEGRLVEEGTVVGERLDGVARAAVPVWPLAERLSPGASKAAR